MKKTKRILSAVLALCMCVSLVAPCALAKETPSYATREFVISEFVQSVGRRNLEESDAVLEMFSDAKKISSEYKDDISRAIVGGILKGYEDRTIRPDQPVRRIEAMAMLARCVPELEQTEAEITFTDVPQWAQEDIAYLTKAGLVKGYGNGKMGANDYITVEQVALLVGRSDAALSTVTAGESFYGYVNEKNFRNAILSDATAIDPLHGAVIERADVWSHFYDVYDQISADEMEILGKIVNGEVKVEKGSAEQRILDLLKCIDAADSVSDADEKNIADMRNAIINAGSVEEFLSVTADIYKLAGINVAFDIGIDFDSETGVPYPTFSVAKAGAGGLLAFRAKTDKNAYREVYADVVSRYLEAIGAEFSEQDVLNAVKLQVASSKDVDYVNEIAAYLAFAQMFGLFAEEELNAEIKAMLKRNPDFCDENGDYVGDTFIYESKDTAAADAAYNGFDVCEELTDYGFTNLEKIIIPNTKIGANEKNLISGANLPALKINALLILQANLGVAISKEEEHFNDCLNSFALMVCLAPSAAELADAMQPMETDGSEEEFFEETTGLEYDEGLLSTVNLNQLVNLMPNEIGFLYAKHYYDDAISFEVADMIQDIADAYAVRFENNTWMEEETKKQALEKLYNIIAVIGYPDNYTYPEITPISEGGTLFSNTLSIKRHDVADLIRANEDKEFIRTWMFLPPDEVNACYLPELNTVNIPCGILNPPFYDKDASYAANLGSIGMVLAHEIGHAFDKSGATRDKNGCLNNWWTKEDEAEFKKIQNKFVKYYNQFEVVDGVVQDANVTITENMADFAAMQILMDIIGDDKEAQKECFEAYANMWAKLGTASYLTNPTLLNDVHAASVVRVNAVVASFEQFYEIYGIEEGDPMYVAPEDRLKLW